MTQTYRVTVTLDLDTLKALKAGGDRLCAFKAFRFGGPGAPLSWFATLQFLTNTVIAWQDRFQAFTSRDLVVQGAVIQPIATCPLDLGMTAVVDGHGGLSVQAGGQPGALSIANPNPSAWTAGLMLDGWDMAPAFATPLYPQTLCVIAPDERVLLLFCADPLPEGEVVLTAPAAGLLVDLAGGPERTVAYDMAAGWTWDGGPWATSVRAGADLRAVLLGQAAG